MGGSEGWRERIKDKGEGVKGGEKGSRIKGRE